jgi:ribosomal protein S18 acetylase RimI-like enzyme
MIAGSETAPETAQRTARRLGVEDLEDVIAIDRAHSGLTRRHFFAKRMAAARRHPDDFVQLGVMREGSLSGFAIARVLRGEFGQQSAVAVLDAVAVKPESQERGVGETLIEALIETLRQMGVGSLQSQVAWSNHHLMAFFEASGFALAPRLALERSLAERLDEADAEE